MNVVHTTASRAGARAVAVLVSAAVLLVPGPASGATQVDDTTIARAGLLRSADVGADWQPRTAAQASRFGPRSVVECRRVNTVTHRRRSGSSVSKLFTNADARVSNSVSVYPATTSATRAFDALAGTDAQQCIQQVVMGELEREAPGSATARAFTLATTAAPRLGNAQVAYSIDARADNGDGSPVGLVGVLVVVRVRRAVLGATFSGPTPPPEDAVWRVLAPPARRLVRAQR
jgi:hypothetical protein